MRHLNICGLSGSQIGTVELANRLNQRCPICAGAKFEMRPADGKAQGSGRWGWEPVPATLKLLCQYIQVLGARDPRKFFECKVGFAFKSIG